MELVLASSSPYRRELLKRFGLPFETDSPDIDESPRPGETATQLVTRLSTAKALAVAKRWPKAVIIGSDQAVACGDRILGKPGTADRAVQLLMEFAGRRVDYITGVTVLRGGDQAATRIDTTSAHFRRFDEHEARRYVELDQPLDCAGAIRFEGLGPLLLSGASTADPSAVIGLPLIELGGLLRAVGINPLR